jgi:hypothetical protein
MSDKNSEVRSEDVSSLELDILGLFWSFSDQWGRVDIIAAADYAYKQYGYIIPRTPFKLTQQHFDVLMDRERIYDVRALLNTIAVKAQK